MTPEESRLDHATHEAILRQQILTRPQFLEASQQERPRAIILAGQPGAGKGRLSSAAEAELLDDVVKVDPDELREFHPRVNEFRANDPYSWSSSTHSDAAQWADELLDATVAGKKNLIFDTTLSNGQWASEDLVPKLQARGYQVEVRAIAAPKLESEWGVDQRFTNNLDTQGYGRYVPEGARDAIYTKLPGSLDTIRSNTDVPIRIFNREGLELYDSRSDPRPPGQALEEARNARLKDPAITQALREGWEQQGQWHRNFPEHVRDLPNTDATIQGRLSEEHRALQVGEGVAARAEGIATIDELVRPGAPPARMIPGEPMFPRMPRAAGVAGLAGLGIAASAYDAHETGERIGTLLSQDNATAARSELLRFGARGAGGLAGGVATATVVGTSGTGPFALAIADAYLLSKAGEKAIDLLDAHRITHQTDRDGVAWGFNGRQWIRDDLKGDLAPDGVDTPQKQPFSALPEKAQELNYLANAETVQQLLGKAPTPRNPFVQESGEQDRAHLYQRDWRRDGDTGQWSRMVADEVDRNDRPVWQNEIANAQRTSELDLQASQTIAANLATGQASIAAQYQIGYTAAGEARFGLQPPAVASALNADALQASDGNVYQRNAQGQWTHDGEFAQGNRALELEQTREQLIPALQQHGQVLAQLPPWQPPTPEQKDQANLRQLYADNGISLNPEQFQATYQAVQRTRAEKGINPANTSLALAPDASDRIMIDSPIQHLQTQADGVVRVVATTTPEVVLNTQAQRQPNASPLPTSPEQRIEAQTPEQREAYTQMLREANQEGVSAPQAEQIATLAAVQVRAPGRENKQPEVEPEVQKSEPVIAEQTASVVAPIQPVIEQVKQEQQQDKTTQKQSADPEQPSQVAPPAAPAQGEERTQPQAPLQVDQPVPTTQKVSEAPQPTEPVVAVAAPAPQVEVPKATTQETEQPALRPGDRGDDVQFLQYRLQRAGATGPEGQPVPLDGTYGVETEYAVRQFQASNNLPATGEADQSLDEALARAPQARQDTVAKVEPEQPVQVSPQQVVERPSPEQREVQTQAISEAQRLGATSEQVQQVASLSVDSRQQTVDPRIELPEVGGSYAGPSFGGGNRSADRDEQQEPTQRQAQVQGFPTDHHDYALFVAIQQQLPKDTPDEKTAEIMREAKLGGIKRPDQLDEVVVENNQVLVFGKRPGDYSQEVSLNTQAPAMNETLQRNQDFDQQQTLQLQQFQEQQARINQNPTGPTMTM